MFWGRLRLRLLAPALLSFFLLSISQHGVCVVRSSCPAGNDGLTDKLLKQIPPCSTPAACRAALAAKTPSGHMNAVKAMAACIPLWAPCVLLKNPHAESAVGACGKTIKSQDEIDQTTKEDQKKVSQAVFDAYNKACKTMGAKPQSELDPDSKDTGLYVHMALSTHSATECPCRKKTGKLAKIAYGTGHFLVCNRALIPKAGEVWNAFKIDEPKNVPFCEGSGVPCIASKHKGGGNVAKENEECMGPGLNEKNEGEHDYYWPPQNYFDACCQPATTNRYNLYPVVSDIKYKTKVLSGIQYVCACTAVDKEGAHAAHAHARSETQTNWLLLGGSSQERVEGMEAMGQELADAGFERGWEAGLKLNRMKSDHAQNHRRRRRNRHNGHV